MFLGDIVIILGFLEVFARCGPGLAQDTGIDPDVRAFVFFVLLTHPFRAVRALIRLLFNRFFVHCEFFS